MRKLILIGVDGGDYTFLTSLIEKGRLKNFKLLIQEGCAGKLKSTIPPVTIPAWLTLFSGKRASAFNAIHFFRLERDYSLTYLPSSYWRNDMLWTASLGKKGIRCGLVNIPGTYPVYPINGFMVSSNRGKIQTYPNNITSSIKGVYLEKAFTSSKKVQLAEKNFQQQAAGVLQFLKQDAWDFFAWVISLVDNTLHLGTINHIQKAYMLIDEQLKDIIKIAEENDANILVVSDHGMAEAARSFNINTFLEKEGYFKVKERSLYNSAVIKRAMKPWVESFFRKSYRFLHMVHGCRVDGVTHLIANIQWEKTKAFSLLLPGSSPFAEIWINAQPWFAKGTVFSSQEKENILADITKKLLAFEDEWGRKPVKRVLRKEELSPCPSFYLPDLLIEASPGYYFDRKLYRGLTTFHYKRIHGTHGIFIGYGPDIMNIKNPLEKLDILNIAPTIAHMFDSPLPIDIDGKVIKQIFKSNSELSRRQARYTETNQRKPEEGTTVSLKSDEVKEIKDHLQTLGYL